MASMTDLLSRPAASSADPFPVADGPTGRAIYLDYAATTPVDPSVAKTMAGFLTVDGNFGNPASATHEFGRVAADAVEDARGEVAKLLAAKPREIVWTSGATEAINLAMKGAALAHGDRGAHIVTSALEHKAVLDTAAWLESQGFEVDRIRPGGGGTVTAESLAEVLRPDTVLVSLMHVNNEIGTVTDIAELGSLIRRHGALFHVDAVQSAARLPLDDVAAAADLISISAHKMYGPKGIGALRVRGRLATELTPLMHGGGHERGLRPGTLPVHQIVGMGHAARLALQRRDSDTKRVGDLDERLRGHIERIQGAELNGNPDRRVSGILSVHFPGVEAESLMVALDNLAVSSGSACTSADVEPSHVLRSLGYDAERALSSVRISFGRFTTAREIDCAGELLRETVTNLRRIAR